MWKAVLKGCAMIVVMAAMVFSYFTRPWHYPSSLPEAACTGNIVGAFRRLRNGDSPDVTVPGWPYEGKAMFLAIDNTGCPKPMAFGLVELLHFYNSNAQVATSAGYTVLMLAASEGNEAVARKLIRWGARVDDQDSSGRTALMYAAESGHENFVRFLLGSGADSRIKNRENMTASDLARVSGHEELARQIDN
ncbi:MAG: ankyrin repeat domain-containing protein [Rhizobiaceae bacterium]|nr:ankyrin repeat domain-containing protein [Rhizobiaceae bacterium]HLP66350.1 ankyrin repeat domain-containing protein [Rhizobium sp.]